MKDMLTGQVAQTNHGLSREIAQESVNAPETPAERKNIRKRGPGRRHIQIDLAELEKLSSLQCTDGELASWFGVDRKTIARKKKDPAFAAALERGRCKGQVSLRRTLFAMAQAGKQGSAAAAIFLAKNILGYRDFGLAIGDGAQSVLSSQEAVNRLRELYGLGPVAPPQLPKETASKTEPTPTETTVHAVKGYLQ